MKPPRLLDGVWYALCTTCQFEIAIEVLDGNVANGAGCRIKGVAGLSGEQEGDMRRPVAAARSGAHR